MSKVYKNCKNCDNMQAFFRGTEHIARCPHLTDRDGFIRYFNVDQTKQHMWYRKNCGL
jgi:hypothetical protein